MKNPVFKPVIAVIGAKGKMASAFIKLFKKEKLRVLEVDINTRLTLAEAVPKADITIVSVPISKTAAVMAEVLRFARAAALATDVTSVKLPVEKIFQSSKRKDIEMIGLHPLFGPSMVSDMRSQVIALCEHRAGKLSQWLITFLKKHGALVKKTTAEEHDECMAVIQGITHFSAIASGMALKKLNIKIATTRAFASPIYSLRLAMIGRILSQSPELYAEIEIENPRTEKAVHAYATAIEELSGHISSKNKKAFIDSFKSAATFLGSYTQEAQKETDRIIKLMRKKQ